MFILIADNEENKFSFLRAWVGGPNDPAAQNIKTDLNAELFPLTKQDSMF